MTSRALSLKQPWAALLASGRKTIEVRRWKTAYRGPLLIHAARVADPREEAWARVPPELAELARLERGIVGAGVLVDCKRYGDQSAFDADRAAHLNDPTWFEPAGLYGLCFAELRVLPYRAAPGWVRLFTVELDDLQFAPLQTPQVAATLRVTGHHAERDGNSEEGRSGRLSRLIQSLGDKGPAGRRA